MCRPGHLCSTAIFNFKWYSDTYCVFNKYCTSCELEIAVGHIANSIRFQLMVQHFFKILKDVWSRHVIDQGQKAGKFTEGFLILSRKVDVNYETMQV